MAQISNIMNIFFARMTISSVCALKLKEQACNNLAERMRINDRTETRTARQSEVLADAILGDYGAIIRVCMM